MLVWFDVATAVAIAVVVVAAASHVGVLELTGARPEASDRGTNSGSRRCHKKRRSPTAGNDNILARMLSVSVFKSSCQK